MALKRNRYVWRLDLSLLGEDDHNSEIGRKVKNHIVFYKIWLWIGKFCFGVVFLTSIALFVGQADLIYISLSGITALLLGLIYCKLLTTPKITGNDIKKLEDELNRKSDRIDDFNVIFTENNLIVQQGIMVYRIPYLEIIRIRVRRRRRRAEGNHVQYSLCDGTKVEIVYYGDRLQSFEPLWEQLLKYNPNIMIEDP